MRSAYKEYREELLDLFGTPFVVSLYNDRVNAPTLLFLPGTMVHPLFYDPFLSRVAKEGINVVGVHFTGHGKSPVVKPDFTFSDLVANTKIAIEFCLERYGENLIVMGSSQGSMVATAAVANDKRPKALVLHDLLLPKLPQSREIINIPLFLRAFGSYLPKLLQTLAHFFPTYPVALTQYLDADRLSVSESARDTYLKDPLCRKAYPLSFIASLFNMDLACATDGSIKIPLTMITARLDPLFTQKYMDTVFQSVQAPDKKMLTFDLSTHILFIESVDDVLPMLMLQLQKHFEHGR